MSTLPYFAELGKWSGDEMRELVSTARWMGADPDDLTYVIGFETDRTFSPSVRNLQSHAVGLIQFTWGPGGVTLDELAAMTIVQQFVYVRKYFAPYVGRVGDLERLYLAVFWPEAMGKANDTVIAQQGSKEYEQNVVFDRGGRGYFTRGDIVTTIDDFKRAHMSAGRLTVPGTFELNPGAVALLGAVAGVAGAWYLRSTWGRAAVGAARG